MIPRVISNSGKNRFRLFSIFQNGNIQGSKSSGHCFESRNLETWNLDRMGRIWVTLSDCVYLTKIAISLIANSLDDDYNYTLRIWSSESSPDKKKKWIIGQVIFNSELRPSMTNGSFNSCFPTKIQLAFKKHDLRWARDPGPVLSGHACPTLLDSMSESGVLKPTSEYQMSSKFMTVCTFMEWICFPRRLCFS